VFSFLAYIVSFLMFYFLKGLPGFVLAFIFYGLGDAFRTGTHKAMILAYLKIKGWEKHKTAYYGQTRSWSQRGSAIAAIISAVLVFYTGSYKYVFLLSVIPYVIDLFLMMSYPSYLNGEHRAAEKTINDLFKDHFVSIKEAFSSWKPFSLIISTSSYTGYYKASKDYLQPLLVALAVGLPFMTDIEETKKTAVIVGVIYSLLYFLNAWVSKKGQKIESKFSSVRKALFWVQLIGWSGGLLAGLVYLQGWQLLAILFFAFVSLVQNARRPMAVKFISDNFNDKIMATILSAESQSETLFAALFAMVLGFLVDIWGVGAGLSILSSFLIVVNLIVLKIRNRI
jgi:hypothetical protein